MLVFAEPVFAQWSDQTTYATTDRNIAIGLSNPSGIGLWVAKNGSQLLSTAFYMARFGDASTNYGVVLGYDTGSGGGIVAPVGANPLTFWTYSGGWGERMRLNANGNLGIGTVPISTLDIAAPAATQTMTATGNSATIDLRRNDSGGSNLLNGEEVGTLRFNARYGGSFNGISRIWSVYTGDGTTRLGDLVFGTSSGSSIAENMRIRSNGRMGIGSASPLTMLHLRATDAASATTTPSVPSTVGALIERSGDGVPASVAIVGGRKQPDAQGHSGSGRLYLGNVDEWDSTMIEGGSGKLSIFTRRPSDNAVVLAMYIGAPTDSDPTASTVKVFGNIEAKYQDVAEWVPAGAELAPGMVVVVSHTRNNEVLPSTKAYDTAVAGVVSVKPGLLLGERGEHSENKAKIATTGRVRVRVDASKHAIALGDLLVSGEKPGTAMFSEPVDISGMKIHRPGTIIGKALEPLASGEGEILVLLSLQ
jgi:hypothetical protein